MLSFIRQALRAFSHSEPRRRTSRPWRPPCVLAVEELENRLVPSIVGPETTVNTTSTSNQLDKSVVDVASSRNGRSVAVWTRDFNGGGDIDVRAQVFNRRGLPVGSEIAVANSADVEDQPAVAMDDKGRFVVVWRHNDNIQFARYRASGLLLRTGTAVNLLDPVSDPSVAMDAGGRFVVSYTRNFKSTGDLDIQAALFTPSGTFIKTLFVSTTSDMESNSEVARSATGAFDIVYVHHTVGDDIELKGYSAGGTFRFTSAVFSGSLGNNTNPTVAMDNFGKAVVAWEHESSPGDPDILAARVNRFGTVGLTLFIETDTARDTQPSVALDPSAGNFVVTYERNDTFADPDVKIREVSSKDNVSDVIDLSQNSPQFRPQVSIDATGVYHVVYQGMDDGYHPAIRDQYGLLLPRD